MADVQLTQTAVELQASVDAQVASNAGLDTVPSDLAATTATAAKKSGFFGLGASSTAAPVTDRSVMISAVRDVAASGEIRYAQIVFSESGNAYWVVDDGGALGSWKQIQAKAESANFTTLTLSGIASVDDATDSTSGTSGSIHTDGGLGVVKNLFVGASATISNVLNLKPVEVTVASGAIARTASVHVVDTEGGAGTDDLHTISGGVEGDILILYSNITTRDTTVKDQTTLGSGNINLAGGADFSLSHPYDKLVLIFRAVQWDELTRSNNL